MCVLPCGNASHFVMQIRWLDTFSQGAPYQPVMPDSGPYRGRKCPEKCPASHIISARACKARYCTVNRGFSLFRRGAPPSPIVSPTSDRAMPALTRRRDRDAHQETWLICYDDVHAGTIMRCVGNPNAAPQWQCGCGFYPGSRPGE